LAAKSKTIIQQHFNVKGVYIELIGLAVLIGCFYKGIVPKFQQAI